MPRLCRRSALGPKGLWAAVAASVISSSAAAAQSLPAPLVFLADIDASIAQDIRYATVHNFTGAKVPGYDGAECVLRQEAAEALARVQAELSKRRLALKVYDCYRPERAVRAFVDWVERGAAARDTNTYFPSTLRRDLIRQGYISARSGHSRGLAVDLTLVPLPVPERQALDAGRSYGACTAAAAQRMPDNSLDMGTGFDCFDVASHTFHEGLTKEQATSRRILLEAMRRHGFRNYAREWWHFSFESSTGDRSHDVPIPPRR
jgi:zinc D-Ala-D-Ala dipeptidase